jgi:SHS2 domain-containing protein
MARLRKGMEALRAAGARRLGASSQTDACEMPAPAHWEHFKHGADIGVRGVGFTIAQAFEQAALAMTAVITDPQLVAPRESLHVHCEAPDDELLLADWLNALIYEMAVQKMLFGQFNVPIENGKLDAHVAGEPIDIARHQPAVEIKGATYTQLRVGLQADGQWLAQCVVDV